MWHHRAHICDVGAWGSSCVEDVAPSDRGAADNRCPDMCVTGPGSNVGLHASLPQSMCPASFPRKFEIGGESTSHPSVDIGVAHLRRGLVLCHASRMSPHVPQPSGLSAKHKVSSFAHGVASCLCLAADFAFLVVRFCLMYAQSRKGVKLRG